MDPNRAAQMHINLFLAGVGHHEAAWRLPGSRPHSLFALEHYRHAARVAEAGKLDSIFFADTLSTGVNVKRNLMTAMEPTNLLAALAPATSRIGLIATASTSYNDPYNLARRLATIDHISGGRAGWNIVTSASEAEARNFSLDHRADHADRYRRAAEFVEVAIGLWDGWEDDALVADKESGLFVDPERLHPIDHDGDFFRVAGPLGLPRSPQGRPVLVQAGSSAAGKDLAAGVAEAVFTAQRTLADGQAFYADIKDRAVRAGRDPGGVKILPGISPYIGATDAEARAIERDLLDLVQTDYALAQLSRMLDREIGEDMLDEKLPELPGEDAVNGAKSRFSLVVDMARAEDLTVRQIVGRLAGGRGHRTIVGTPEQVADDLQLWFENGAADGFNYMPPSIPDQLEVFVDTVVPILQERGIFRADYEGTTLRDHYGLERPPSRFASRHTRRPVAV
ncbi:MAG TPA: LLM class flavin-dependent oxidoreductase [Solirubrobacterales bacterium]|nr:LLM class flavin-dependent oxidoreductase [Solirubrobacterales bacterium]